ncbi:putative laccase [Tanacetum coccineum]
MHTHLLVLSLLAALCYIQSQAALVRYTFVVQETNYTRLCSSKNILTVNGQYPGPTISARRGDTVIVDVINQATQNITIHWHGVKQPRYPWSDGPEFITQCPIQPGSRFSQKIILSDEEGTLWWHAHSDWSRATVHGLLVVSPKIGTTYPFPKPHAEVPVILGDWWKNDIQTVMEDFLRSGGDPLKSDALTINGQPGDRYNCSRQETTKVKVDQGKTYMLRMVNAAMNNIMFFAIADHQLTVVGTSPSLLLPLLPAFNDRNASFSFTRSLRSLASTDHPVDVPMKYIGLVDTSMRTIIKEEVKTQLPQFLPQAVSDFATPVIEKNVTESLEAVVLTKGVETTNTKIKTPPIDQTEGRKEGSQARKLSYLEIQEEPSHNVDDSREQENQEFNTGNNDEQPANKEVSKADCQVARSKEPTTSFDELMNTPIDFSAFVLNRQHHRSDSSHSGRTGIQPNEGHLQESYRGGDLSRRYSTSVTKTKAATYEIKWIEDLVRGLWVPEKILKKYDYGHLEEIEVRRDDQELYKFREGDFLRLRLQDIEDMLLLLVQQKLTNLIIDERYDLNVALRMYTRRIVIQRRMKDLQLGVKSYQKKLNLTKPDSYRLDLKNRTAYTLFSDPQGVIYVDNFNRKRLMRIDELHKFSDDTLNDVRIALHDISKGMRMEYLLKRKWSGLDKKRARVMVQDIGKQLFERRLIRNLEKFVGGREYGNDLRLQEWTI